MDSQEIEQDPEFEAFLRQFKLGKPKPLPNHRRIGVSLAAAAVLLLAVVIPLRFWQTGDTSPAEGIREAGRDDLQLTTPPGASRVNAPVSLNAGVAPQRQRLRVGGAIKAPVRLVNVNPVYPEDAQAAGIEGLVVLEIVIGETGAVIETQVLRSVPELDQAAIDAVTQWKYEPTLLNGEPVEIEMAVAINFTLS